MVERNAGVRFSLNQGVASHSPDKRCELPEAEACANEENALRYLNVALGDESRDRPSQCYSEKADKYQKSQPGDERAREDGSVHSPKSAAEIVQGRRSVLIHLALPEVPHIVMMLFIAHRSLSVQNAYAELP